MSYLFVTLWPAPSAGTTTPPLTDWAVFVWTFPISDEVRLIILVFVTGALGAVTHSLWALYIHVSARKDFDRRWGGWYVARPFVGALFGLLFYLVLRAGLFSPGTTGLQTSAFGFAAVAALVGFFSEEASEKLRQIAEDLFSKVPREEGNTGTKVSASGEYVFARHLVESDCQQPHVVEKFNEGGFFAACPKCSKPATWKLIEKSGG